MNRSLFSVIIFTFLSVLSFSTFAQQDTSQKIVPNRKNSPIQQGKPYVILISADGFRYDYTEKYKTPYLNQLAKGGLKAEALIPSFPSITFPNHYTIVTGMYPSHHGLVGNNMYDPKTASRYSMGNAKAVKNPAWYGGVPIWTLAEQQELLSACFYWPGSEAAIGGKLPTYYYPYNEKIPIANRIQTVVDWLSLPEAERPHLISFYFPEVDHMGHLFGPDAPETEKAVLWVDSAINALNQAVKTTGLPVNFIFVSDHGMTTINREEPLKLPIKVDTSQITVASNGTILNIHVKDKKNLKGLYNAMRSNPKHYQVFLADKVPAKYHYNKKDDRYNRIGDIILIADAPYYFSNNKPYAGAHGYDHYQTPDMQATFIAWGPAFKQGLTVPAFENVHIYPILTKLLGLPYDHVIDGKNSISKEILK